MKRFCLLLLCVVTSLADQVGVLYDNSATNNQVSPATLSQPNLNVLTNLTLSQLTASRALYLSAAKVVQTSALTSTQSDQLGSIVGGLQRLILGQAEIISGNGPPTNGTAYISRIFYINSAGTNLNDTYWGNYGTNWYAIASTNGGSINESQLNFSDVTTANSTTNRHGLLPKLDGNPFKFFNGAGGWSTIPFTYLDTVSNGEIPWVNTNGPTLMATGIFTNSTGLELRSGALTVPRLNVTNTAWINELFMTNSSVPAESLLRLNTAGQLKAVTIGSGLNWNGVTLSATGGTNVVGITGSPASGQVTYWSGPTTITGSTNITFSGTNVIISGLVITNSATVESGSYVPTVYPLAGCTILGTSTNAMTYTRVGKIVSVNGLVQVIRTDSSGIQFDITVPIVSDNPVHNIADDNYLGHGFQDNGTTVGSAKIYYDLEQSQIRSRVLARVEAVGNTTAGSNVRNFWISFTYDVTR